MGRTSRTHRAANPAQFTATIGNRAGPTSNSQPMTTSLVHIEKAQATWSRRITVDSTRTNYAATIGGNLFRGALQTATEQEFREGDGAELNDAARRPAKMRAL